MPPPLDQLIEKDTSGWHVQAGWVEIWSASASCIAA